MPEQTVTTEEIPSDLEAVLAKVTPERRADFLLWRMRLGNYQENDEILAIASLFESTVVIVDALTKNMLPPPPPIVDTERAEMELEHLSVAAATISAKMSEMHNTLDLIATVSRDRIRVLLAIVFLLGVLVVPFVAYVLSFIGH